MSQSDKHFQRGRMTQPVNPGVSSFDDFGDAPERRVNRLAGIGYRCFIFTDSVTCTLSPCTSSSVSLPLSWSTQGVKRTLDGVAFSAFTLSLV